MITVTGKTFEHRDTFKRMRGNWNETAKQWEFYALSKREIDQLRGLVGCLVNEDQPDTVFSAPDDDDSADDVNDIIAQLFGIGGDNKPKTGTTQTAIYGDDQRYFNYFKDTNPLAFFGFSSLGAMVDYLNALPDAKRHGQGYRTDDNIWSGSRNMQGALDLVANGWPQGMQNAAEIVDILNVAHATKRCRSFGVTGGHVSVGRMLSGNPEHMVRRPKQPGRKIVTLFVENNASAFVEADILIARAAAIAGMVDIIEREGYSCEIVSTSVNSWNMFDGSPGSQVAVTLKTAGEKLNLNDLVFSLGHPSFLRRLVFALVSSSDECRRIWDNQGYPGQAFNSYHQPKQNEFYIRHLNMTDAAKLTGKTTRERALEMLPMIEPENLPVQLLEHRD